MSTATEARSWDRLRDCLSSNDSDALNALLHELGAGETLRAVFRLSRDEQQQLLTTLSPDDAAELVQDFPEAHAASLIDHMEPSDAASIVDAMASDEQADLLGEIDAEDAENILQHMATASANDARRLIQYDWDTAGGLMKTEFIRYPATITVASVLTDLRQRADQYARFEVPYLYVVANDGVLLGVLRLRDAVVAPPHKRLKDIVMAADAFGPDTPLDELADYFDEHELMSVPIVDEAQRILGVVRKASVSVALKERADEEHLRVQGIVGGDELRTMPVLVRSRRRLSWLSVNIFLNIIAASVIAMYQDTLSAVIALAVILPIVSDMSGCSGNQAVAVSMRELSLGVVSPLDALRVWWQEVSVGVINGIALGSLLAMAAWLWQGNGWLGAVVGAALAINTVIAVSIGGTVPLLLKRAGLDPALASGPLLTTVTDMCGFFLVLSFASMALPLLT